MPRGRKKVQSEAEVIAADTIIEAQTTESAVNTVQTEDTPKPKRGCKPRKNVAETTTSTTAPAETVIAPAAQEKTEPISDNDVSEEIINNTSIAIAADNAIEAETAEIAPAVEAPKPKRGRKPRADKDVAAPETEKEKVPEVSTPKRGRKPRTDKTVEAAVDKAVKPKRTSKAKKSEEKPKRTYNRKTPAQKTTKTVPAPVDFIIQSGGNEYTMQQIADLCKKAYTERNNGEVENIKVYLKHENGGMRAYYVVNNNPEGLFIEL